MLQREFDEVHRRSSQLENEKRTVVSQLENCKRDRVALIKKIEMVTSLKIHNENL